MSLNSVVLDPAIGFFRKRGNGKFFTKIRSDWIKRDITIIQNLSSISRLIQFWFQFQTNPFWDPF